MLMAKNRSTTIALALLTLAAALPAAADTRFRVRQMTRNDVPLGKGQCDIRLQVDNEVEVAVRGDSVMIRTIQGRDAYDDGSECNAPLPTRDVGGIGFEVRDRRNDIQLLAEPAPRNNFTAVVRIRDSSGGQGRYHFRLTWQMTGSDYRSGNRRDDDFGDYGRNGGFGNNRRGGYDDDDDRSRRNAPPGFAWNNVLQFSGRGRGEMTHSNLGDERLSNVEVNIDRGGRVVVAFRGERNRMHTFQGVVNSRDGGRLRADVVSEDRRLRGPMLISVDGRQQVNSITLQATDGRDRLRLNWDRR